MIDFSKKLSDFSGIDLEQLNASASFLDRIDTKFLLTQNDLSLLLEEFEKDFYVLNIGGKSVFQYDNVYMDSEDYLFYNQHQEKADSRVKIRTRNYLDSNLAFFEFKQKQKGVTRKFRYQIPVEEHGIMTKEAKGFFKGVYMSFYGDKTPKISPSLRTTYSRMTLVSKDSSERLTIDFNIQCKNLRSSIELSDSEKKTDEKKGLQSSSTVELTNLVIIESKSMSKNCKSLTIMKENNFKKAKSCSKYGLGLVYCRIAQKYSVFEDTMRKISEIRKEMK